MWLWQSVRLTRPELAEIPRFPFLEADPFSPSLINPSMRFAEIFETLHNYPPAEKKELASILLSILAWQDIAHGLDVRQLELNALRKEILQGFWGANVKNNFEFVPEKIREQILQLLYERKASNSLPLERSLSVFFPDSKIWLLEETDELIFELSQTSAPENVALFDLLLELFLPVKQKYRTLWQKAPCILDKPSSGLDSYIICQ